MSSDRAYHVTEPDLPPEALQDHMKPPDVSTLVHCLHCGEEFESLEIIWVPFTDEEMKRDGKSSMLGMWRCPIEGCDGAGVAFDMWPVDPDYVDPETGEKLWHDEPPMFERHESDCECAECEMARDAEEAEFEREAEDYRRKVANGEITPLGGLGEDDIPF